MEMTSEYKMFDDQEEEGNKYAETPFIDDDQEEREIYSQDRDTNSKKLPFTIDEKRQEIKKYFHDTVYNDSLSRTFLNNITFEHSATADNEMDVFYKNIEIGTIDLDTKTPTLNMDNMISSGYRKDHRDIINRRNKTFIGQIEENTGEQGFINDVIAENVRKKFAIEMQKREGLQDPGEHIEMVSLQEDYNRLEKGKKLETQLGREILDQQITNTRRILEFRRILAMVPGIGFLLVSAVGIVTAIVLFAKGQFYNASKSIQPKNKKKSQHFDPIQQLQKMASQILESSGDHFEILITVATITYFVYRSRKE